MDERAADVDELKAERADLVDQMTRLGPHEQGGPLWTSLQAEASRLDAEIAAREAARGAA